MGLAWEHPPLSGTHPACTPIPSRQPRALQAWSSPLMQPSSSLLSLQSYSLSHCWLPWMQVPSEHWNSSGRHVATAGKDSTCWFFSGETKTKEPLNPTFEETIFQWPNRSQLSWALGTARRRMRFRCEKTHPASSYTSRRQWIIHFICFFAQEKRGEVASPPTMGETPRYVSLSRCSHMQPT